MIECCCLFGPYCHGCCLFGLHFPYSATLVLQFVSVHGLCRWRLSPESVCCYPFCPLFIPLGMKILHFLHFPRKKPLMLRLFNRKKMSNVLRSVWMNYCGIILERKKEKCQALGHGGAYRHTCARRQRDRNQPPAPTPPLLICSTVL